MKSLIYSSINTPSISHPSPRHSIIPIPIPKLISTITDPFPRRKPPIP